MARTAVLGTGIVGTAAAWDLVRRGHEVVVADADGDSADAAAAATGATSAGRIDATTDAEVADLLGTVELVVSAVPYALGLQMATTAIRTETHYLDFGGNPAVVARQLALDADAVAHGVTIVPDCGLAPGMANVLAMGMAARLGDGPISELRLRVGALPVEPVGALGYQLAFNPAGLVNEYAEPCEVLRGGALDTVEPLTGLEDVAWEGWGPLEAFHTAGGSSSLARHFAGVAEELDYKTLRYPGHGAAFRAMLEVGLFSEEPQAITEVAPRSVLLAALDEHLPRSDDDLVLVRVWASAQRDGETVTAGCQVEDRHDGRFSALARTTAFPATALADLILRGDAAHPGVRTMDLACDPDDLVTELGPVGITVAPWAP